MITMTVNDLLNVIPVLRELLNKPFKGSTAFKLARLMREVDKETTLFEESRQKLAEKFGMRDEGGNLTFDENGNIQLQPEKLNECNEEMLGLLNTTLEINAEKIPMESFADIDIAPAQVMVIDTLVDY
jgi:hypothetical protein